MILVAAALLLAAAPLRVDGHWVPEAAAKGGDNGKGNNGKDNDNKANDNDNRGNNGNGRDNGEGKGESGNNGRGNTGKAADSVVDKKVSGDNVQIRYRNGYSEQLLKGRFIMKDSKGRTIIDRRATAADRIRLWLKQVVP
ncbi:MULTISPECIES: hypothetical protein [unclassified Rhizobium]|uniref:hypothetical protein n=1 Tax=unclassified Rhizobium TaxID=2613769 RepID=UPI0006FFFDDB|nr:MULTISPECIES: hypothetical protein [unclassified Rhizobium]KQV40018.1 hypothetical protein ASC86_22555 [Rhizobium sp. Root1212]KRD31728.1 hypothetical protein ASE37_23600 [Rhizobium sp. Root268]